MKKVHVWTAAVMLAAVLGLIYAAGAGAAGDNKAAIAIVDEIAAAIKKGDMDGARKLAGPVGKKAEDMADIMELFKIKKKGGIGFGPKETDGIESKVREAARDVPKVKDAPLFEEAAYRAAAIGLIAEANTPNVKEGGKKTRKNWEKYTQDMVEAAQGLAKASKSKGAADMKSASTKLNNSCNACHSDFKN